MKLFKNKKNSTKTDLLKAIGQQLYTGPFSGLKVPEKAVMKLSVAEILGLYESCLHSKLAYLLNRDVRKIVMVGGNNGYYAAGLSYIFKPEMLHVYETLQPFHGIITSWFERNQLNQPEIFGAASADEFKNYAADVDFLFLDCEGFEVELLNPELFPWQLKSDILFEMHPFYVDNLLAAIASKFSATHHIEIIYDDFEEDAKVDKILHGIDINISYPKHPTHRWIEQGGNKIYTSGMFMFLTRK